VRQADYQAENVETLGRNGVDYVVDRTWLTRHGTESCRVPHPCTLFVKGA
jgi:hypothetical protein